MRAKILIASAVVALAGVVAVRWRTAQRRSAAPVATEPGDPAAALPQSGQAPSTRPPAALLVDASGPPVVAGPKAGEAALMAAMRADLVANPARALQLARDAERRFGETPHAAE